MQSKSEGLVRLNDEAGTSAIEFAIVLPVFLTIVFGIIAYGVYFGTAHNVQQLVADAARASVAGITPDERASLARAHIDRSVASYPLLRPKNLKIEAAPSAKDPNLFEVRLHYDASDLAIYVLEGLVPLPDKEIRREAVIRRGGY
jgi:Flp pilus assembly protein TadG